MSFSFNNISLLSFDKQGNLEPINSPNSFIWVGHASFHPLLTESTSHHLPAKHSTFKRSTLYKQQKLAVRQLATLMINKIVLEDKRSDTHMSIDVDESNYPYLVSPLNYPISFSHSQNQVACVIQRQGTVGIDVELKSIPSPVCHRFFAQDEMNWLLRLTADDQAIGKRLLWMVKEASLKRLGDRHSQLMQQLRSSSLIPTKALFEEYKTYEDSNSKQTDTIKDHLMGCRYIDQDIQNGLGDQSTDVLLYLPSLSLVTASTF